MGNDRKSIKQVLLPYSKNGSKVVLESGWNWGLLQDIYSGYIDKVKVAHPLKVRAIAEAKIKTDKIPRDSNSRHIQQVLRQRLFLVRLKTMVKRIHNLIDRQENIREEALLFSDLFGAKMLLRYEIDNIERFPTSDKLCSYAGLVPFTYSSGAKTEHGRIIKQGNKYIRWALIEVVVPAIKADTQMRSFYYSMKAKKGSNSAKVTTARRLLKIVY
ncbi:IS110 family transposase [bacterium]|nr:IS110 family transposase [bacterium]